jgi:hypothetical protein
MHDLEAGMSLRDEMIAIEGARLANEFWGRAIELDAFMAKFYKPVDALAILNIVHYYWSENILPCFEE